MNYVGMTHRDVYGVGGHGLEVHLEDGEGGHGSEGDVDCRQVLGNVGGTGVCGMTRRDVGGVYERDWRGICIEQVWSSNHVDGGKKMSEMGNDGRNN